MTFNWSTEPPEIASSPDEEAGLMKAFAQALLYTPDDGYAAARKIFPEDATKALYIAKHWLNEQIVLAEMKRLLSEHGAMHFLPNKVDVAREVFKLAKDSKTDAQKLAAYKFYAELQGYMPQRDSSGGNNTNLFLGSNKVMQVSSHGSDDEWERRASANQQMLIDASAEDISDDAA